MLQIREAPFQLGLEAGELAAPPRILLRELLSQQRLEASQLAAPSRVLFGEPLSQLGVEPGEVELAQFPEVSSIRGVHLTVMREYPIDFIGIDYAIDNRGGEERIFPLAQDEGIAVLVYLPFGRSRMWQRIGDRQLPEWAAEFDAHTWAQFMLKFVIAHPAVTVATPGTGNPKHMVNNLGGGRGRLPTPDHLERMLALVESLPSA